MKTDHLIEMLARGAGPAPRAVAARRLIPAGAFGVSVSAALALALMGPLPQEILDTPAPWIKLAYAGLLALPAGWLAARLARPVSRPAMPTRLVAAVLLAMAALGATAWATTPEADRLGALFGSSWGACPWNVLALSMPALAGILWALRGLAPTRPHAAGCAAGLLAGALGAGGYALTCPETSAVFVAVWYSLGIGLVAGVGTLLGPRVLRW
ncbi:MAG: DUF1109 domain-containing protein [Methylibium sp.]|uniref:DUF1109 domain-containing protein n=1 Tax=Methylibium sp. TaxID=2067992 RepID=UPI0017E35948|nr:DUF1109 domain-containing protein [Methylibium sp.]MBA2723547.1 DUF1109 domain-containing protein [Methylibium sp.]MBA3591172.1 DUF1109 domain-containing protein [Methylibium sp.]